MKKSHCSNNVTSKLTSVEKMENLVGHSNPDCFLLIGPSHLNFPGIVSMPFEPPKLSRPTYSDQIEITNRPLLPVKDEQNVINLLDSPQVQTAMTDNSIKCNVFSLPVLINDGKEYTPTFWTQSGKVQNGVYQRQFLNKVKDYRKITSKKDILVSRPRSKYLYCSICKDKYQEYLGHVNSKKHLEEYQKNSFMKDIASLELTLNTGIFRQEKQKSMRQEQKSKQMSRQQYQELVEKQRMYQENKYTVIRSSKISKDLSGEASGGEDFSRSRQKKKRGRKPGLKAKVIPKDNLSQYLKHKNSD